MRVTGLPGIAELGDGSFFAVRNEDRVVAEALAAARLRRNASGHDACAAELLAVGRDRNELGHVACSPILDALELAEQLCDRRSAFRRVTRRLDARPSSERRNFDPRVLTDRPRVRNASAPERGLDPC